MATPKIRLQGFTGEWEKKLLGDCLEISEEKNTNNVFGIEDVLSVSDEKGVVNQIEHLGRSYAGKSVSGYKILRPGQIVYTKSPLRAKPFGIVKQNEGKAGIVSVLYAVYNTKEGVAPEYIHYFFSPSWRLNAYMRPLVNKGAKNTMNISNKTVLSSYIMIPKCLKEQTRLADSLHSLDNHICVQEQRLEKLKRIKTAALDSMFPQEGENTPRVRFKGFDGTWKKTTLGDIFSERTESDISGEMLSVTMNKGVIKASENGRYDNSNSDKSHYKLVKVNDIAYNSMRMWQGASGRSPYEGIVSPAYTVVTPIEGINSWFFAYLFKTRTIIKKFRLNSQGLTSDTWNLKYAAFSRISVLFPEKEKEQHLIASFFQNLDRQISIQEQRLEKLKHIKAACLNNMFV